MIVDGLVPDPRRPGSTRVCVEGRPAWTVPADVVDRLGLRIGGTLRGDVVEQLDRAADEEGAFRAGLRAIARRAHGKREIARKLERKGHDARAIAAAVERLSRDGLLDDFEFAAAYIAAKHDRGRGPVRLRHDLGRLGVPADVVSAALAKLQDGTQDPLEHPRALAAKRIRQLHGLPAETRRRRLTAFLARRGYGGGEARQVIEEALGSPTP
ncbi:MAG: regulatory protein RecX [Gemmatimonadales bacterium]